MSDVVASRFPVAGMTCSSCVNRIMRALRGLDGVDRVRVDLAAERVTVWRDPTVVSDEAIAATVIGVGYEPDLAAAVIVDEPLGQRGWRSLLFRR